MAEYSKLLEVSRSDGGGGGFRGGGGGGRGREGQRETRASLGGFRQGEAEVQLAAVSDYCHWRSGCGV
ncbi:hypothetical protein L6164_006370 [Bauhinia variegata]|uniref:Uncharacterized protein n=1 Tax=Bauhinia variegata TaxID=167791 RepID=A0ACB9PW13_BAUVA|nr:hypothetical protein L6164_006370 [Bauhinia variegata]